MSRIRMDRNLKVTVLLIAVLLAFVFGYSRIESWLYEHFAANVGQVASYSLPKLTFEFFRVSITASVLSIATGMLLGIFAHSSIGRSFKTIIQKLAMIGQTIPVLALLLFAVTIFGVGMKAALVALVVQSASPVIFGTISGLDSVPHNFIEIAHGLGYSKAQTMFKVQLPLAKPVILSGIRIGTIICISAATLAFSAGAGGLGLLIQTGIATYNMVFVFEGTVPIVLIAIIADRLLRRAEKKASF